MDTDLMATKEHKGRKRFTLQIPRRNQRQERGVVQFHPAHACASGRKARSIARRSDTILRWRVRQRQRDATLQKRIVSTRAASHCQRHRNRRDAGRERDTRRLTTRERTARAATAEAGSQARATTRGQHSATSLERNGSALQPSTWGIFACSILEQQFQNPTW